ncbi:MAG: ornithine carbamoyltransferase [Halobacteriales archaeon SW_9_67_25]|nr:MAG: ornithine carbamoyltransferase [Halobacteriales archaeon SW_9_67_25]
MTRNFVDIDDLTTDELHAVLDRAATIKAAHGDGRADTPLTDQTLGMIFEKPSTRTRVSFETGMTQLGGHAIFLGPDDIHLGHQTLADLLTIRERFGFDASVAWVGDGNNVCQSFVLGAAMVGLDLTVATPAGYGVDEGVLRRAEGLGSGPETTTDPAEAIAGADVVYTDVWVSMGQEDEREQKLREFEGFQLTTDRVGDRTVMHCLPAHRGEEITDDVLESDNAIVWNQAENRMHAQKGLLTWLDENDRE